MRLLRGLLVLLALLSPSATGATDERPLSATQLRGLPRSTQESASWGVLRKALLSSDYAIRLLATQALGDIQRVDVSAWLDHCLADPEHDVRVAAVDSLKRVGSRRALELLRTVRDDTSEALDIRALAASALLNRTGE